MRLLITCMASLAFAACSASDTTNAGTQSQNVEPGLTTKDPAADAADCGAGSNVAPPHLVVQGNYSDERFLDMMAAHHQMAIEMSKVALSPAEHAEVREFAKMTIDMQGAEIETLRSIKREAYGTSHVPLEMNPHEMENSGSMSPDELAKQSPIDRAFIDGMLPHHSGAIEMASLARLRSDNPKIRTVARKIIDVQIKESNQLLGWRMQWYPNAL